MIISATDSNTPTAEDVTITDDTLTVELRDGRTISVPLDWFPRLANSTRKERNEWRLVGKGQGIHWPLIDEDVGVEGLLAGRPSGEGQESFKKWMAARSTGATKTRRTKKKTQKPAGTRKTKNRKVAR